MKTPVVRRLDVIDNLAMGSHWGQDEIKSVL